MRHILFFLLLCISSLSFSQEREFNSAQVRINQYVDGTLITPFSNAQIPLVIFIMDQGAINRDGNERMSKNDTFKKFSRILAQKGIASYRYDKRLFRMDQLGLYENDISFNDFITDVKTIISYFRNNNAYSKIIIAGHGQGALVGMIAAQNDNADGFISLAGYGQSIDNVIIDQLKVQAPGLDKNAAKAFKELREKGRAVSYQPALGSIFRYNLQPFMRSWMKYDPAVEIQKLEVPILLIQGDNDLQITLSEYEKLKTAVPEAKYLMLEGMNHIFTQVSKSSLENQKSYNEPWREIMPQVIDTITDFVMQ
ncbi:alpha/beta hydrolase [Aquimarina rhabdastrellae]